MATEFPDYYGILGLRKEASEKEIRSAFRKLARQHHPDVNPGNTESETRFKAINEANEVLSDPEKRALYDQLGPRWREYEQYRAAGGDASPEEFARASASAGSAGARTGASSGGFSSRTMNEDDLRDLFGTESPFSDFFNDAFGGTGRRQTASRPRRGTDAELPVEVSLEDAYRGTSVALRFADPDGNERTIEAGIPRGVHDGSRVRLAGQGNPGRGGAPSGDLYLVVSMLPHPLFRRDGDDLRVEIPVELTTCVLGGEVHVGTLKGTRLAVRVPAETQNGQAIRLRGQGMPKLRTPDQAGDLYVEVRVVLPTHLNEDERALFARLAELRSGAAAAGGVR